MPSPREEKMRESYREGIARALVDGGHMGMSLAFTEAPRNDSESVRALRRYDTQRALQAADACLTYLRTRSPFLPEVLAELKEEERLGK